MERIECPQCQTSYTLERCGLRVPSNPVEWVKATVLCSVCKRSIEATVYLKEQYSSELVAPPRWKVWQKPDVIIHCDRSVVVEVR